MDHEELLEEAAKRYPKGTTYKPIGYGIYADKSAEVTHVPSAYEYGDSDQHIDINIAVGYGYVYFEKEWAEVIHKSIDQELEEVRQIIYKD